MLSQRMKIIMISSLFMGLLLGLFLGFRVGIGIKTMQDRNRKASEGIAPIKSLRITVNKERRNMLIDQLQQFADKNAFAIRVARHDPNGYNFSVDLWREDIWISGLYPADPETMSLGFYYTVQARPVAESVFDEVINDLESYINEIPGATLAIEK